MFQSFCHIRRNEDAVLKLLTGTQSLGTLCKFPLLYGGDIYSESRARDFGGVLGATPLSLWTGQNNREIL